jgi:hypothetical protein
VAVRARASPVCTIIVAGFSTTRLANCRLIVYVGFRSSSNSKPHLMNGIKFKKKVVFGSLVQEVNDNKYISGR